MPELDGFVLVANTADFASENKLCLEVEDRFVVIVKVDDQLYCIDDVCTHDGGTLGDGVLTGHCLECPRHGAQFDVRNGNPVTMPATEPTVVHDIRVENDQIFVRINQGE